MRSHIATLRRFWPHNTGDLLAAQQNLANAYFSLKRYDDALRLQREVYAQFSAYYGRSDERTILSGNSLVQGLLKNGLLAEATTFARQHRAAPE